MAAVAALEDEAQEPRVGVIENLERLGARADILIEAYPVNPTFNTLRDALLITMRTVDSIRPSFRAEYRVDPRRLTFIRQPRETPTFRRIQELFDTLLRIAQQDIYESKSILITPPLEVVYPPLASYQTLGLNLPDEVFLNADSQTFLDAMNNYRVVQSHASPFYGTSPHIRTLEDPIITGLRKHFEAMSMEVGQTVIPQYSEMIRAVAAAQNQLTPTIAPLNRHEKWSPRFGVVTYSGLLDTLNNAAQYRIEFVQSHIQPPVSMALLNQTEAYVAVGMETNRFTSARTVINSTQPVDFNDLLRKYITSLLSPGDILFRLTPPTDSTLEEQSLVYALFKVLFMNSQNTAHVNVLQETATAVNDAIVALLGVRRGQTSGSHIPAFPQLGDIWLDTFTPETPNNADPMQLLFGNPIAHKRYGVPYVSANDQTRVRNTYLSHASIAVLNSFVKHASETGSRMERYLSLLLPRIGAFFFSLNRYSSTHGYSNFRRSPTSRSFDRLENEGYAEIITIPVTFILALGKNLNGFDAIARTPPIQIGRLRVQITSGSPM